MKLQLMKSKGCQRINIQYDGLQYKPRNKTFKAGDYLAALDFALALPDRYVCACEGEIWDWAQANHHPILRPKSWEFA